MVARTLGGIHIDCGEVALQEGLTIGYDNSAQSHIIDTEGLSRKLRGIIKNLDCNVILEGHLVPRLAGFAPSRVFVLRCHPNLLVARLRRKGYTKKKIAENIAAEILDLCLMEAIRLFGIERTYELDVSGKGPSQVVSSIIRILKGGVKRRRSHIDWISRLEREGKLQKTLRYIESGATPLLNE